MSPLLCHQLFLAAATLGAGTQGAGNPSMALGGGFLTLVLGLLQPGWQSFLWCVESQAAFCISANEAVEMQPVSFTNLDLPERNLFLLDRDLSSGLDMAGFAIWIFSPTKSSCVLILLDVASAPGHPASAGEGFWQAVPLPFIPPWCRFGFPPWLSSLTCL